MPVKYFSGYFISGLTLTPPAKTNSHLLLWWSWTLREGRKWPFHLICLSSQQFVKFNWNALVSEKFWTRGENNFATRELDVLPDLVMSGALQHLDHLHVDYTRWGQEFWIYNISYMHQIDDKDVDLFIPKGWMDRFVSIGKSLNCNESLSEPCQRPWAHSHSWGGQSFQRSVFFLS